MGPDSNTQAKEVALAHQTHQELAAAVQLSKRSFVIMGRLLYELKAYDRWMLALGHGAESWTGYLAQPEIGLSKGEADRLIQIYEQFVLWLGLEPEQIERIPLKNLHYLLPIAKQSDDPEEILPLVEDAEHLSQRDFRERIHDVKTGEEGTRTYEFIVMKKCIETGSMQKVHDLDSETIKQTFNLE